MNNKLAVILINYNSLDYTKACVISILENETIIPHIIIVDNHSQEPGIEKLKALHPNIHILLAEDNLGFGNGNNFGVDWALKNTDCQYIFLLNNDTIIQKNTLTILMQAYERYPDAGIISPAIVFLDQPDLLWYGGGHMQWYKGSVIIENYKKPLQEHLIEKQTNFASGCAMLIKTSIWQKLGGFDKRFFMYEEDLELSLRMQQHKLPIYYIPSAVIQHKVQGSMKHSQFYPRQHPKNPKLAFFIYHMIKNKLLTMYMHAKGLKAIQFWSFFPLYVLLLAFRYLIAKKWNGIKAIFQAVKDFIKAI